MEEAGRPLRTEVVDRLRAAGCVFAEDEASILLAEPWSVSQLQDAVRRRADGVPLEHIVGWAAFCGRRVSVTAGVFVPRRRTEFLAQTAIACSPRASTVVDLCCGSGAVGLIVATVTGASDWYVVDVDPVAVSCARGNVTYHGGQALLGDLYDPLPTHLRGHVDLLLANAPYVPTSSVPLLPAEARIHEPHLALDGGLDGLAVQRRVAERAPAWLGPGGHLVIETSAHQAPETAEIVAITGMTAQVLHSDTLDATVVIGSMSRSSLATLRET